MTHFNFSDEIALKYVFWKAPQMFFYLQLVCNAWDYLE